MVSVDSIIRSVPIEADDSLRQRLEDAEALYGCDREWAASCRNYRHWEDAAEGLRSVCVVSFSLGCIGHCLLGLCLYIEEAVSNRTYLRIVAGVVTFSGTAGIGSLICLWEGTRRKNEIAGVPHDVDSYGYTILSGLDIDKINRHGSLAKDESLYAIAAVALLEASTPKLKEKYLLQGPDGSLAQYDANLTAVRDWFERVKYAKYVRNQQDMPIQDFGFWRGSLQ